MMQEIQTNTELPVLPSEDERFCISGYRCCMSNQTSVFSHVGKITFSRKQCSPSFPVTVLEVIAVKEQMGKVIGWVNAQVPAGDNEGEEERGKRRLRSPCSRKAYCSCQSPTSLCFVQRVMRNLALLALCVVKNNVRSGTELPSAKELSDLHPEFPRIITFLSQSQHSAEIISLPSPDGNLFFIFWRSRLFHTCPYLFGELIFVVANSF